MRFSFKWISNYVDIKDFFAKSGDLAKLLTGGGLEVEAVTDLSKQFNHVVIGHILKKEKHPNADLLSYCFVDVGTDQRWIVCGAKNHKQDDKVIVALPGAVLPGNFEIKVSKIRGSESHGMLCSLKELGLTELAGFKEQEGIVILSQDSKVGASFAESFGLSDVLIDVKVTPNRADCLSHLGLAREISALAERKLEFPIKPFMENKESTKRIVKLRVEDPERCPRYAGRVVKNVKVGPSPAWLKSALESVGQRSINNVVDITNFVMLELGQPLHAFDLALISGSEIVVRSASKGEKFTTLDDVNIELNGSELLICDGAKPVALAGIKGGKNSGVSEATKDIFIEAAVFAPWTVRRTSRLHGIDTDSSYRFSRGIDLESVLLALNRATQLVVEICGGDACGEIHDQYPKPLAKPRIDLDLTFINLRLGVNVPLHDARRALERVGCQVTNNGNKFSVNPPGFRLDLKIQEDLGEEILRIRGYDMIPETMPVGGVEPQAHDFNFDQQRRLSRVLRGLGLNESVNYGFLSDVFQNRFLNGEKGDPKETGINYEVKQVELVNPLNIDLNVMRISLLPWLTKGVAFNNRHQRFDGSLFEIGSVFSHSGDANIFKESVRLACVEFADINAKQTVVGFGYEKNAPAFFNLKGRLEEFFKRLNLKTVRFESLTKVPAFFHPGQAARIFIEGKAIGIIGTLHPGLASELEVLSNTAVCEIDFEKLVIGQPRALKTNSISKFPATSRDVAFLVPLNVTSSSIQAELLKACGKQATSCELFDVYEGEKLKVGTKSLAYRVMYQDPTKTLSDDEVNGLHQKAIQGVCQKLGLEIR